MTLLAWVRSPNSPVICGRRLPNQLAPSQNGITRMRAPHLPSIVQGSPIGRITSETGTFA